jgi:apolipoprotein N-acyltransferase
MTEATKRSRGTLLPVVSLVVSGCAIVAFPLAIPLFDLPGLLAALLGYVAFRGTRQAAPAQRRLGEIALASGATAAVIGALWLGVALVVSGTEIFG